MKRVAVIVLSLVLISLVGCTHSNEYTADQEPMNVSTVSEDTYTLKVNVYEVHDTYLLVASESLSSTDAISLISIPMKAISDDSLPTLGDTYEIIYNGDILETYPLQLSMIYEMKRVNEFKRDGSNTLKMIGDDNIYDLYAIDVDALMSVIKKYSWMEGTSDCLSDYELVIDNVTYTYHSDCGTINDITHSRSFVVNENDRIYLNELLKQFVQERMWNGTVKVECY